MFIFNIRLKLIYNINPLVINVPENNIIDKIIRVKNNLVFNTKFGII